MGLKEEGVDAAEIAVKAALNEKCDAIVAATLEEVKKMIPGQWDDALLESMKSNIQSVVKAELLKLAEKISPRV